MQEKVTRRIVLQQSAAIGAFVMFGASACSKKAPLACTDVSALAPADAAVRTALGYMDSSTVPGKMCSGCQQFNAPSVAGTCGTCKVVKGSINPLGYCKSFVAKPT